MPSSRLALERKSPLPHGYAVAYGLVTELVLSKLKLSFPSDLLHKFAAYVKEVYPGFYFSCDDYPRLIALMRHDKRTARLPTSTSRCSRMSGRCESIVS